MANTVTQSGEDMVKLSEAAFQLRQTWETTWRQLLKGELRGEKRGARWFVSREDIERRLNQQ